MKKKRDIVLPIIDKIVSESLDGASKEDLRTIVRDANRFVPLNYAEYVFSRRLALEAERRLKEANDD